MKLPQVEVVVKKFPPPLFQKCRYRITSVEGDKLTVVLFDQEGNFGIADRTRKIVFDGETLIIAGHSEFKRIED